MSFFKKITKDFENLMGDDKKPKDEPQADQQRAADNNGYAPPQPQYGAPPAQYGAPQGQYGAPQGQYGAPQGQYGAPQGQYGAPPPGPPPSQ
ncbi:hypothetical protein V501_09662, partial [Pseudogymnoascus sp. VKM F-4519 (FW-2642)]